MTRPCEGRGTGRGGFTLVELLVSVTVGLLVLISALGFAVSAFQGVDGNKAREDVYRNVRFIGMTLQRDLQTTGVGIESEVSFGTLNVFNDTVVSLHVPWDPPAYAYEIDPPTGTTNPLPPGGTCGATCIDLQKQPDGTFDLRAGDLARLQVNGERRLVLLTDVKDMGSTAQVTFSPDSTLLHLEAAFAGGLQLDRTQTFVQKLQPVVYWMKDHVLYRADRFDTSGELVGSPMAWDVQDWQATILFVDGGEADAVNPYDTSDHTDDYDDLLGVRVMARLGAGHVDRRVNDGELFTRSAEWRLVPRNLMYERNR